MHEYPGGMAVRQFFAVSADGTRIPYFVVGQENDGPTLMTGYGSIIGLRPAGGAAGADAVVDALRLWVPATSLGGVESTLERRRRFTTESETVPEDLLRLSVGIEDVEDLWADLSAALDSVVPSGV